MNEHIELKKAHERLQELYAKKSVPELENILEHEGVGMGYAMAFGQLMIKDFGKAAPHIRDFLDQENPQLPRLLDVYYIHYLDHVGPEQFSEDMEMVINGDERRREKLRDSISRVIDGSDYYEGMPIDELISAPEPS